MKLDDLYECLQERIRNITADVEFIYRKGDFQRALDDIHRGRNPSPRPTVIKSSELITEDCRRAHSLNPIEIICHKHFGQNRYIPTDGEIHLNLIGETSEFSSQMGNPQATAAHMGSKHGTRLMSELSEGYFKGVIMHELSHWIDDSLNNGHMRKRAMQADMTSALTGRDAAKEFSRRITGRYNSIAEFSSTEIEGQIHTIAQVRRQMTKAQWDSITFSQMMNLVPIIGATYDERHVAGHQQWVRNLKKRMHREGLLGRNMR